MGTSSSYGGPTGDNPLLPDWAQDGAEDLAEQEAEPGGDENDEAEATNDGADKPSDTNALPPSEQKPVVNFTGAKSSMTRFVNSGGGGDRVRRVARNYVGARGGSRHSARAATSGRASTGRLGSFLSSVASRGVAAAANAIGLVNLAGRSSAEVFAEIADRLAPSGATLEEAAARRAVDDALCLLYKEFDLGTADVLSLDAMGADAIRSAVEASVAGYVYHRWLQELGDRIEDNSITADQAVRLEREVKDYVDLTVQLDFRNIDVLTLDWEGPEGQRIVERIYQEAYGLLEQ